MEKSSIFGIVVGTQKFILSTSNSLIYIDTYNQYVLQYILMRQNLLLEVLSEVLSVVLFSLDMGWQHIVLTLQIL